MLLAIFAAACLSLLPATSALSSWYTVPGSNSPAGSTAGDKVRGVNLGGWFVLEAWMQPSLFQVSPLDQHQVPDEWTYCLVLGKTECRKRLQAHWDTWIVEDDFKRMADYGLNTVRLPLGYWVWNVTDEPFISGSQLPYIEKALNWSSMYGMDVVIDMHGVVGSQSGQDNSGRYGDVQFGWNSSTVDRTLSALAQMVKYTTQDKFNGVVKAFELVNEPYIQAYISSGMEWNTLADYMSRAYTVVRQNEHIIYGANQSMVMVHDAFRPLSDWTGYWFAPGGPGSSWTNYALDTHIYQAFGGSADMSESDHLSTACGQASSLQAAQAVLPVIVGEWSLGVQTFCVNYQSCFNQSLSYAISTVPDSSFNRQFWEAQVDVYEANSAGYIFWSWKTELAPTWSYEQSVAQEWIPVDPDEKLYPFTNGNSWCLDIYNPIDGDQNIPDYPTSAASISSGTALPRTTMLLVTPTNTSSAAVTSPTTMVNSTASLTTIRTTSTSNSVTITAASATAKSGASDRFSMDIRDKFALASIMLAALVCIY